MVSTPTSATSEQVRYSVDDDLTLQDVDRLLQDDQHGDTNTYPRLSASSSSSGYNGVALVSLASLFFSSATSAYLAPHVATQSLVVVVSLPFVHFALLAVLAFAHGVLRPRSIFGGGANRISLGRGDGPEEQRTKKLALLTGGASAVAMVLGLWQARWLDGKLGQAVEVFVLPTLLALAPLLSSSLTSVAHSSPLAPNFTLSCLASAFLVGLALFGVPARHAGLALAALRLPVVAVNMILLKEGLGEEHLGTYLMGSATSASLVSLVVFVLGLIHGSNDSLGWMPFHEYIYLALYHVSTLGAQISLLVALYHLASPLQAAITLLPRNLILLLWATFGRGGLVLRSNWLQMAVILAGGTVATLATDDDLSESVLQVSSRVGLSKKEGWNKEHLPSAHDYSNAPRNHPSRKLVGLAFLPLLFYFVQSPSTTTSLAAACSYLPTNVRSTLCHTFTAPTSRSVDLVIAYYNEDLAAAKHHIQAMRERPFIRERQNRVLIYNKGPRSEEELREKIELKSSDEVIPLPNYGREGATYLKHILLHYNSSIAALASALDPSSLTLPSGLDEPTQEGLHRSRVLADHTFFLQPHLAWDWIANPRIDLVGPDTGFAHFGPMMKNNCGEDMRGVGTFPYVKDIYNIFRGEVCPRDGVLSAWSAQFQVRKGRILANAYHRYEAFDQLMEAEDGHWIHELWGANDSGGQSNPALGHHLERSWPLIFGCSDPKIAEECPDDVHVKEKCQCLDN
ncbi:hypothetical protein BCR35DRAFT_289617 [Leucosporidium creatinivorum]|uniref:Uncharacterized protein n=1 Tax=Leucosporidium creatinivorum TaxID=106004 RepID=A0A1Y2FVC4_9BASI|nr:hypothetical protein BCR35DRAFT_289617 [Leucosporidium creatinivorum]